VKTTMDHFKFEYEVCMDSVTMNKNLETDGTKFFWMFMALVHSTAGFGLFALLHLTHDERVPFE
jgi:TRAP-type C4-dicarboxylate transport system permease small subunit